MNLVLILDDVAVVVVIVFLGEFQSRLKGICDLICVDIMVQGIRAYSPTTTTTEEYRERRPRFPEQFRFPASNCSLR